MIECSIIDLNSFECPSISVNYFTQNCQYLSKGKNVFNKHCAKEKAIFYFNWLTNEWGICESGSTLVTEFNNLRLDYGRREPESFNLQRRNHKKTENQFLQKKVKLLLSDDEIRSFTHLVYYIEPFFQRGKQNVKNPESVLRDSYWCRSTRLVKKLTGTILHCQKRFNSWWRKKECRKLFIMTKLRDSECFMVKMKDFLTEFDCYELFYVEWLCFQYI